MGHPGDAAASVLGSVHSARRSTAEWTSGLAERLMRLLLLGLVLVLTAWVGLAAQKPDAPAPKKPAATKPAAAKPADAPQAKPTPKSAARPVVRRVAPPPVLPPMPYLLEVYKGDVPTDPGMRSWQPPLREQR